MLLAINSEYFVNSINRLEFATETRCVFSEIGTEFVNII
jgi:hypothetical protein